jgi:hypothetical protein
VGFEAQAGNKRKCLFDVKTAGVGAWRRCAVKRAYVVVAVLIAAWSLPSANPARGFPGMGGTSVPGGLPFGYGSTVSCTGADTGLLKGLTVNLGWLEERDGSKWALQRQTSTGTATWPLRGLWAQATEELTFDKTFGLMVSGGIFVPRHAGGAWYSSPGTRSFDFEIPSYDWWSVDGIVKARVSGGFELLGGFRWDHTSARVDYSDNTSDDYILNAYLPLIGAQMNQRFSNSSLLIRFLAAPWVPGSVKYHFWDRLGFAELGDFRANSRSSYFEVMADYRLKLRGDIFAGGFVKFNSLRLRTDYRDLSGSTNESVAWAVDIKSWVIGGVVSLDFFSPFCSGAL